MNKICQFVPWIVLEPCPGISYLSKFSRLIFTVFVDFIIRILLAHRDTCISLLRTLPNSESYLIKSCARCQGTVTELNELHEKVRFLWLPLYINRNQEKEQLSQILCYVFHPLFVSSRLGAGLIKSSSNQQSGVALKWRYYKCFMPRPSQNIDIMILILKLITKQQGLLFWNCFL